MLVLPTRILETMKNQVSVLFFPICIFLLFIFLGITGKETRSEYAADVVSTATSDCTPKRQSPIDLVGGHVPVFYNNLVWSKDYFQYPASMKAENNGETIKLSVTYQGGAAPKLSGGPLSGKYVLSQIHFHWGTDNLKGSEHTVLGTRAPMEIHCVHIREGLTTEEANKRFDGYTVVAYFVQVSFVLC